ncbi:1-acyl-sn-glycerol-3-phosphate acyltransferase [Pseudoalteromonas rubra]|uniref:1-acyl-sn-glycerol-3-phosphate acyltransferase n=1 Tax=Pseudoalteromonas rubra TaxID=43658 RepID=A0A5S3WJ21_9GAMM|nr:1-acylglycerol-3-phosphate O-acyltransferase [Pseudoalteromonas rubra]TMP26181.1 1-acyl-sn-glycerol-3-phosphate acyltransferase [Pseudoalteromonas rubra]TMP32984.1 1-acyl-sn-glycerol-3-phosphate acyltransferase [Pseudoalteromonas rubra]
MLAVVRILAIALFIILSCLAGLTLSLIRPFHANNVHVIASWFGKMSRVIGVKLEISIDPGAKDLGPAMYIANHQNNYDLFTLPAVVPHNTVSMGKKSLKWVPFFGQLYWLSGNILIDRANRKKAVDTLDKSIAKIKQRGMSLWMFPEGTRSYGRGLLPFKTGAFHTALSADVPVVPVCMNNTAGQIKLNRWDNGTVYIDILAPMPLDKDIPAREHAKQIHAKMAEHIAQLDEKVRAASGKLARDQ